MRARSKKRQQQYADERIPLVKKLLAENPICVRCWQQRSVDVHEVKSRARGGSITDPSNLVCLCRGCHDLITRSPAEAQKRGWLKNSWEK